MEKGYYPNRADMVHQLDKEVAIHNKNGKGLLLDKIFGEDLPDAVAIHNKNGKGLLLKGSSKTVRVVPVAIHNKNGKGLLPG